MVKVGNLYYYSDQNNTVFIVISAITIINGENWIFYNKSPFLDTVLLSQKVSKKYNSNWLAGKIKEKNLIKLLNNHYFSSKFIGAIEIDPNDEELEKKSFISKMNLVNENHVNVNMLSLAAGHLYSTGNFTQRFLFANNLSKEEYRDMKIRELLK